MATLTTPTSLVSAPAATPASVQTTPAAQQPALAGSTEARGFALYIGLDELKAITDGVSLAQLVSELKAVVGKLAPSAEAHATVALSPRGAGGNDLDIVRRALRDPGAVRTKLTAQQAAVTIDLTRKSVEIADTTVNLTYKEFELLEHLIDHEGETVHRIDLLNNIWEDTDADRPNERTIDVHVRRLRSKLGEFSQIVRTVRGIGYRFDNHADVDITR